MPQIRVFAEGAVGAPAEVAYRCIADYVHHHPSILPANFSDLRVEEGGYGAGTVFTIKSTAAGRTRNFHMDVTEPHPGRVLVESDRLSSIKTVFTVEPRGQSSLVSFETTWSSAPGIGGFFERTFAPLVLKRVYREELIRLDAYARGLSRAS